MNESRLNSYLRRIGFSGPVQPDLATLTALHAAHVNAIPFEGCDPLLRRPVNLDLASVQQKLVNSRRGGYCFEQNTLFKAVLEAIGFKVTGLGGRVRWMSPPDSPLGPREHMLLKVDLPEGLCVPKTLSARCGHAPNSLHGHPGQAYRTGFALAEWFCRTGNRVDPARVRGPFYRLRRGASAPDPAKPMLAITMRSERIGHWAKTRQSLARFNGPASSVHARSLAAFITIMCGFRFFGTHSLTLNGRLEKRTLLGPGAEGLGRD